MKNINIFLGIGVLLLTLSGCGSNGSKHQNSTHNTVANSSKQSESSSYSNSEKKEKQKPVLNQWGDDIRNPHVTTDSFVAPNFTFKFTKVTTAPHFESDKMDATFYYSFQNTSDKTDKPQNLNPSELFYSIIKFQQESDTSIVDLQSGNPDNITDEQEQMELAAQNKVKPGATVNLFDAVELDNTNYPLKAICYDDTTQQDKVGTITLNYKGQ